MNNIKKGYKVVRRVDGWFGRILFYSFRYHYKFCGNGNIITKEYLSGCIRYKLNKFVYPKSGNGPLAVFNSLIDAQEFVADHNYFGLRIYTCEYEDTTEIIDPKLFTKYDYLYISRCPPGTRLASKVKLLNEV